ncbi:hypothetical protein AB1K32_27430 [Metabacillus dongyingensis]|uniref:hypothetical protein n=1 Tax=Metabacillus dongyingensis TaxID=2874282 RepID=UPI003B8BEB0F
MAEKWSALQQHQTNEMKLFGFNEDEGTYYEDEPNGYFGKSHSCKDWVFFCLEAITTSLLIMGFSRDTCKNGSYDYFYFQIARYQK